MSDGGWVLVNGVYQKDDWKIELRTFSRQAWVAIPPRRLGSLDVDRVPLEGPTDDWLAARAVKGATWINEIEAMEAVDQLIDPWVKVRKSTLRRSQR